MLRKLVDYCGATAEDYLAQAIALLPSGRAWPRSDDNPTIKTLAGLVPSLARLHAAACKLLHEESFPCTSTALLPDWERNFRLPDPCSFDDLNRAERRQALCAKISETGGQSLPYYSARAAALGYPVSFHERRPFVCGLSQCGGTDELGPANLRFHWTMRVLQPRVAWFECGVSECGKSPMAHIRRAQDLECLMQRIKPGHTKLTIGYQGA